MVLKSCGEERCNERVTTIIAVVLDKDGRIMVMVKDRGR